MLHRVVRVRTFTEDSFLVLTLIRVHVYVVFFTTPFGYTTGSPYLIFYYSTRLSPYETSVITVPFYVCYITAHFCLLF